MHFNAWYYESQHLSATHQVVLNGVCWCTECNLLNKQQQQKNVLWPFVPDYPDEPVSEETFKHSHLSWSSIILYQPPPTIHSILPVQFACLTVFLHNFSPSPLWSGTIHFTLHTFIHQSLSSFHSTCPYYRNLFCCSTETVSSIPSLSLNSLLGTLSFTLMSHIHLTILISARCSATIFIPYRPGLTSMQHTTSHRTAVQSPSHNQWYIHIGK